MEQVGILPKSLIDLTPWAALFEPRGPVLSLVVSTPAATPQASQKNLTRWEDERRRLESEGLPPKIADAVDDVVREAHQQGEGLALYATRDGILHVEHSPVPPGAEFARWDSLPSIAPLIDWAQHQPRYLVITVDHQGADLLASGRGTPDVIEQAGTGSRYPVERNRPGGWSQSQYQRHAIDNWAKSAREVAEAAAALTERVGPEVILVGGDPHSVSLLREALPRELDERVEEAAVSRAADGEGDEAARQVARMVATTAARDTVEVIEEFRLHLGRGDRAVEGEAPTFAALREGRVAALLFHDDPTDTRRAWFGADPGSAAMHRRDLEGVGSGPLGEGRLIDVALRAAATTSSAARLLPRAGGPFRDIGALLRWER